MSKMAETDLYAPIKAWLEARGFEVKAEVGAADVFLATLASAGFGLPSSAQGDGPATLSRPSAVARQWVGRAIMSSSPSIVPAAAVSPSS